MAKSKTSDTDTPDAVELQRQLAEMTARATAAESRVVTEASARREAEKANMSAQQRQIATAQEACDSQIESLDGQIENFENQIAALADEPGHGKEVASLTRKLSEATAARLRETDKKVYLAGQMEQAKGRVEKAEKEPAAGDIKLPDGRMLSVLSPQSQAFIRKHPELQTDGAKFSKGVAAAMAAIQLEGIQEDSPEMFEYIETKLGMRPAERLQEEEEVPPQEEEEEVVPPARPARREAASAAAPVSRQAPNASGKQRNTGAVPRLSPQEQEVALDLYGGNMSRADAFKKYAENKAFMENRPSGHFAGFH